MLAGFSAPCSLIVAANDLSVSGAVLRVTVAHEAPPLSPTSQVAEGSRPFSLDEHVLPPDMRPEAAVLVFGGFQRLAMTPRMLRQMRERFTLIGPHPSISAGPADSPWAASLLPAPDREGFEWAILLGGTVAYDPPWRRDGA
jgi:hypothetical protein